MRDGNGPRALETLVRYPGSVLAELFPALAALKLLQAGARGTRVSGASAADLPVSGRPELVSPARKTKRTREMSP